MALSNFSQTFISGHNYMHGPILTLEVQHCGMFRLPRYNSGMLRYCSILFVELVSLENRVNLHLQTKCVYFGSYSTFYGRFC